MSTDRRLRQIEEAFAAKSPMSAADDMERQAATARSKLLSFLDADRSEVTVAINRLVKLNPNDARSRLLARLEQKSRQDECWRPEMTSLEKRLHDLETRIPAPGCPTCHFPQVILYDGAYLEKCPVCGQTWTVIKCQGQAGIDSVRALLNGVRTIPVDSDRGREVLATLADCGAVSLPGQEPQSAQETRPAT